MVEHLRALSLLCRTVLHELLSIYDLEVSDTPFKHLVYICILVSADFALMAHLRRGFRIEFDGAFNVSD
jgi:hypothetical protein